MTFRQFAFNNVTRNKRLYAAYFLSSMFMVMVFFSFSIFAYHPILNSEAMEIGLGYRASVGMNIAQWIIYLFSFFFVLYSMSSFLKSRKKEFGLLFMQGMSSKQVRLLVFLENMLIGFFATVGGVVLGLIFAKAILLLAQNVLILDGGLDFYFPVKAILITLISFLLLFLFISLFVSVILRSGKLIDLIKGDKKSKGEPKASIWLTILTVIMLAIAYVLAIIAKREQVFMVMVPVIVLVIIGTYFLFTQLSVYVIRKLKSNHSFFWRKTNMLLFADLAHRMKDNARTFFMVAIISTVAFCAIGTIYGLQSMITGTTDSIYPYSYQYEESNIEDEEAMAKVEEEVSLIKETLSESGIDTAYVQSQFRYYDIKSELPSSILVLPVTVYNNLAMLKGEELLSLSGQEIMVAGLPEFSSQAETQKEIPLQLKNEESVSVNQLITSDVIGEQIYYIVPDEMLEQVNHQMTREKSLYVWQSTGNDQEQLLSVGQKLSDELDRWNWTARDYEIFSIKQSNGHLLFIGLFIGIVFFVCAGSFLYFRLYSDLDEDKEKFKSISKMGLTEKEMKKVLNRQITLLFFAPIVVALIHGFVALNALSNAFQYSLLNETVMVLGIFFVIQVVYFFIVRFFYTKQIKEAIS